MKISWKVLVVVLVCTCVQVSTSLAQKRDWLPRFEVTQEFRPPTLPDCSTLVQQRQGDICYNTTSKRFMIYEGGWDYANMPACTTDPPTGTCTEGLFCRTNTAPYLWACASTGWTYPNLGYSSPSPVKAMTLLGPWDADTDGTVDSGCPYDICVATAIYGPANSFELQGPLQTYITAHTATQDQPIVITFLPGYYYLSDSVSLAGKAWWGFTGIDKDSVRLDYEGTGFVLGTGTHDVAFSNMRVGPGAGRSSAGPLLAGYVDSGDNYITNISYENASSVGGLFYVNGSDASPGPRWFISGNTCISGHYCLDIRGVEDPDSDGTTNAYSTVYSTNNTWMVENYVVMPVDLIGEKVSFFSQGDSFIADCVGLKIGYNTYVGTIASGPSRVVDVNGATFYIGPVRRTGASRATCNQPVGGPAAICLGGFACMADTTYDSTGDTIRVSSSSFMIYDDAQASHSVFLHMGLNVVPVLHDNFVYTDTTTGWEYARRTQTGTILLDGGNVFSPDISNTMLTGWAVDTASARTLYFTSDWSMAQLGGIAKIESKQYLKISPQKYSSPTDSSHVILKHIADGDANLGNTSVTELGTGYMTFGFSTPKIAFMGPEDLAKSGLVINAPGDGSADVYAPDPMDYAVAATLGAGRRWTTLYTKNVDFDADGSTRIMASSAKLAGANFLWADLDADGTVESGDVCIGDGGIDQDCDGTADTKRTICGNVSMNPPSIGATSTGTGTAAVTGLAANDVCTCVPRTDFDDDLVLKGCYGSSNQLNLRLYNPTAGAIDAGAQTVNYCCMRP